MVNSGPLNLDVNLKALSEKFITVIKEIGLIILNYALLFELQPLSTYGVGSYANLYVYVCMYVYK